MTIVREFPHELNSKTDPQLLKRINQLFEMIYQLQLTQIAPAQVQQTVQQTLLSAGLIGAQGQPLIGQSSTDPLLSQFATAPGTGTVTNVTGTGDSNITVNVTLPNTTPNVSVTIAANPSFTTLNASTSLTVSTLKCMGRTSSAADPGLGELPVDKEWCIHKNTTSGNVFLAYNDAATVKKVQLV